MLDADRNGIILLMAILAYLSKSNVLEGLKKNVGRPYLSRPLWQLTGPRFETRNTIRMSDIV